MLCQFWKTAGTRQKQAGAEQVTWQLMECAQAHSKQTTRFSPREALQAAVQDAAALVWPQVEEGQGIAASLAGAGHILQEDLDRGQDL